MTTSAVFIGIKTGARPWCLAPRRFYRNKYRRSGNSFSCGLTAQILSFKRQLVLIQTFYERVKTKP